MLKMEGQNYGSSEGSKPVSAASAACVVLPKADARPLAAAPQIDQRGPFGFFIAKAALDT